MKLRVNRIKAKPLSSEERAYWRSTRHKRFKSVRAFEDHQMISLLEKLEEEEDVIRRNMPYHHV